jgi:hypothetical protein
MQDELVAYLEAQQQGEPPLTNWQMAARLGISESNWSHIKRRRRLPHRVFELAVVEFPGLLEIVRACADRDRVPA